MPQAATQSSATLASSRLVASDGAFCGRRASCVFSPLPSGPSTLTAKPSRTRLPAHPAVIEQQQDEEAGGHHAQRDDLVHAQRADLDRRVEAHALEREAPDA